MVAITASRPGFSPITMKPGDIALHRNPLLAELGRHIPGQAEQHGLGRAATY